MLHQPVIVREDYSLYAVTGVDFGQNMCHMGFDGGQRNEELVRDLLIAQTMGYLHQHLAFAVGKQIQFGIEPAPLPAAPPETPPAEPYTAPECVVSPPNEPCCA